MRDDLTALKNIVWMALILTVTLSVLSGAIVVAGILLGITRQCDVKEEPVHVRYTIPFKGTFGD